MILKEIRDVNAFSQYKFLMYHVLTFCEKDI